MDTFSSIYSLAQGYCTYTGQLTLAGTNRPNEDTLLRCDRQKDSHIYVHTRAVTRDKVTDVVMHTLT